MKSTLATILGTAALGFLKKQMGSSTRLVKKTEYEYMMYFILIQDGYNWETDTLEMENVKDALEGLLELEEEPIELVNKLYTALFKTFTIYTPCGKYIAQFRKPRIEPEQNETMEKLAYIINAFYTLPEVWFHKEEYEPIEPENFNHEFWLIKDFVINNVLNKFSSFLNQEFPGLNCKAKWKLLDESMVSTITYNHFMNEDGNYPNAFEFNTLSGFGEEILLAQGDYSEQSYSSFNAFRTEKIYNADTGKEYKPPEPTSNKLRMR